MPARVLRYLFSFAGRVRPHPYLFTGIALVLLKFSIDWSVAAHFGSDWKIWYYILPPDIARFPRSGGLKLYLLLWAIAVPFFLIGISLTLRRLRDAGAHPLWIILFFVPIANLGLFLCLSLAPSKLPPADNELPQSPTPPDSAALAIAIATVLGLVLTAFSAKILLQYTWGLFLGVPFLCGFVASWFLNAKTPRSAGQTVAVSTLVPVFIGLFLIGFRWEGLVCLVMAMPLAVPFSIAGALAARQMLITRGQSLGPRNLTACVAVLPLLMFTEHTVNLEPPVRPVVTRITIDAPVANVWKNVIAFPPLPPPQELMFRAGIAYPIGAVIHGSGVGAVRYCRFSTGDFVEPITVWDENHLLALKVVAQPPSLREIGLGNISTPHIDRNYMRSQHGQFRLVALDANHTLLEGTTWYQDYFWPQIYWRGLSDAIVHHIHLRVLEHVKSEAEAQTTAQH
jgi:uncharacterized membrane protein YhaH (DUF805 family)